jgi:hypothetical protein
MLLVDLQDDNTRNDNGTRGQAHRIGKRTEWNLPTNVTGGSGPLLELEIPPIFSVTASPSPLGIPERSTGIKDDFGISVRSLFRVLPEPF